VVEQAVDDEMQRSGGCLILSRTSEAERGITQCLKRGAISSVAMRKLAERVGVGADGGIRSVRKKRRKTERGDLHERGTL